MRMFLLFAFGMATHYALDVLLIHVSGGLALLWPLSWQIWALQLVRPDNWLGTTILVAAALLVCWCTRSEAIAASDGPRAMKRASRPSNGVWRGARIPCSRSGDI